MTTPLDATSLSSYVGSKNANDTYVAQCWAEAVAMVNAHLGAAVQAVPGEVIGRMYLECGSELYHRQKAPNGVAQFATLDGSPIRVARDPMVGVYPLAAPYVIGIG
jgi:hypothetical protein